jgi:hypothetical protein
MRGGAARQAKKKNPQKKPKKKPKKKNTGHRVFACFVKHG